MKEQGRVKKNEVLVASFKMRKRPSVSFWAEAHRFWPRIHAREGVHVKEQGHAEGTTIERQKASG